MARRLLTLDLCDDCIRHGIPDVPAVCEHLLSIDGDRLRRVQLCERCRLIWQPFITLYKEYGQAQEPEVKPVPAPTKRSAGKPKVKAVKSKPKPKELERAPAEEAPAAEAPAEVVAAAEPPPEVPSGDTRKFLLCPLDHKAVKGPKRVAYSDRNSHADMLHNRAKIWEIPWEDPDGILPRDENGDPLYACDVHVECMKNVPLAFTTQAGLRTHKIQCPLPRIDQEGASQKSDGRTD